MVVRLIRYLIFYMIILICGEIVSIFSWLQLFLVGLMLIFSVFGCQARYFFQQLISGVSYCHSMVSLSSKNSKYLILIWAT